MSNHLNSLGVVIFILRKMKVGVHRYFVLFCAKEGLRSFLSSGQIWQPFFFIKFLDLTSGAYSKLWLFLLYFLNFLD